MRNYQGSTEGAGRLEGVAEKALRTAWEAEDTSSVGHSQDLCLAAEAVIHKGKTEDPRWHC